MRSFNCTYRFSFPPYQVIILLYFQLGLLVTFPSIISRGNPVWEYARFVDKHINCSCSTWHTSASHAWASVASCKKSTADSFTTVLMWSSHFGESFWHTTHLHHCHSYQSLNCFNEKHYVNKNQLKIKHVGWRTCYHKNNKCNINIYRISKWHHYYSYRHYYYYHYCYYYYCCHYYPSFNPQCQRTKWIVNNLSKAGKD